MIHHEKIDPHKYQYRIQGPPPASDHLCVGPMRLVVVNSPDTGMIAHFLSVFILWIDPIVVTQVIYYRSIVSHCEIGRPGRA
jgi:hypothetical protein